MKFGFFSMPYHGPKEKENWSLSYDRDMDKIVYAEKMGFDEFFIGEHHTEGIENVPVPEYYIAKASAMTHHIHLGTGVLLVPFHDPFQVAERLAFLDQLTKGRLIAGMGVPTLPGDLNLHEMPREEAKPRTLEGIDVVEAYLNSKEPLSYEGNYYKYNNRVIQVRPYKNRKIPIAVPGLSSDTFFKLAAERNFISISPNITPVQSEPGTVPSLLQHAKALDEGARNADKDPKEVRKNWRILREVYVAETREQAIADIKAAAMESYEYLISIGLGPLMRKRAGMTDKDITFDFLVEELPWVIGSPDDCIQTIKQMQEELGGFGGILIDDRNWTTDDKWRRSVELFARKVMPAFENK